MQNGFAGRRQINGLVLRGDAMREYKRNQCGCVKPAACCHGSSPCYRSITSIRGGIVSMIPGVSRSGTTIVSGMLLGADKRSSAEFSFWLAMPTMAGAFVWDMYKSRAYLNFDNSLIV